MAMVDHLHRDGLNGKSQFTRHEQHLDVEAEAADRHAAKDFARGV